VMMLLLSLSNWPKETDWSFIHSVIYCHPRLNSNWSYLRIEDLLILLAEIALMLWLWICGGTIGLFGFWFKLFELWLSCWAD
jgi:hypothetical protein